MRRGRNVSTEFLSIYDLRVESVEVLLRALRDDNGDPSALRSAADRLKAESSRLVGTVGRRYRDFAELLGAIQMLMRWAQGVRAGKSDSDRFLRAARQRAADVEAGSPPFDDHVALSGRIRAVEAVHEVDGVLKHALEISLPLPLFCRPNEERPRAQRQENTSDEPAVAVVSFEVDDQALEGVVTIEPGINHDLSVSVALSRWPEGATALVLEVFSVEKPQTYELPRFVFRRANGHRGQVLTARGRLRITVPQTLRSRPMEFSYGAHFESKEESIPLQIEGQRRFELRSHDPRRNPITGYRQVDERLMELCSEIRKHPGIPDSEIAGFLLIMSILGGLAARSLQDATFTGSWSEERFQAFVKQELRRDPRVAAEVEEHSHAGGGIVDLSFKLMRIELKVEPKKSITVSDAAAYRSQTTQYVAASDRRLGIIAILDTSLKRVAPHSVANDIALVEVPPTGEGAHPVLLGVVVLRGNLARPSDLS